MTPLFADTFFYLALLNHDDAAHQKSSHLLQTLSAPTVTTAWVMTEIGDALAGPMQRHLFLDLLKRLSVDQGVTIISPTKELFDSGIDFYARRLDKEWSLTDCISFVVMHQLGITDALTGDRHFEQAGFNALLR